MTGSVSCITLRPMQVTDAAAVAHLSGELGYPATAEQMTTRLETVRRSATTQPAEIFVACDKDSGEVVGWIHVAVPAMIAIDAQPDIWVWWSRAATVDAVLALASRRWPKRGRATAATRRCGCAPASIAWMPIGSTSALATRSSRLRSHSVARWRRTRYRLYRGRTLLKTPQDGKTCHVSLSHRA
jgi:hypothetical protein